MKKTQARGTPAASTQARRPGPGHGAHLEMVRLMLMARSLERRALELCSGPGRRAGIRGRGSEAVAVGAASALGPDDRLFAPDRYLAGHLARGLAPEDYLLRCLGGRNQGTRGDVAAIGYASPGTELVDLAAGAALALQLRGVDGVAMALVPGEAYASGHCDQALRSATSRRLGLVVVVEGVPGALATAGAADVEAMDVEGVAACCRAAIESIRPQGGPAIVFCRDQGMAGGPPGGEDITDPVERELHRLACNPATRELLAPLRRDIRADVLAATQRAQALRSASWRGTPEAAAQTAEAVA